EWNGRAEKCVCGRESVSDVNRESVRRTSRYGGQGESAVRHQTEKWLADKPGWPTRAKRRPSPNPAMLVEEVYVKYGFSPASPGGDLFESLAGGNRRRPRVPISVGGRRHRLANVVHERRDPNLPHQAW